MVEENTNNNVFTLRVNNAATLDLLNELSASGMFESGNVLLNKVLDFGIVDFARRHLKKRFPVGQELESEYTQYNIPKILKNIERGIDDIYVMAGVLEFLATSLFNERCATLAGDKVAADDMKSGHYGELIASLQEIKKTLGQQQTKRSEK